ncbi:hypothetical protein Rsub_10734 [Raphidocelis subcapitata]|uniref:Histidine decarboxylase n=1 Tax=Raphidocelis subcapitata TaxID=307507 RepID=A0A2V0PCM6_9CHLO|nr:hypothetical protein Rsub_10734 [Raphidocelis subcapitata]|eukprot:GBF97598.1 hypothetical protein Rsub_10734 [Raphidocelis subcapitata]
MAPVPPPQPAAQRLRQVLCQQRGAERLLGYQLNLGGWEGLLAEGDAGGGGDAAALDALHLNNVGCPFSSRCPVGNTNLLERDVVRAMGGWLGLPRVGGLAAADGGPAAAASAAAAAASAAADRRAYVAAASAAGPAAPLGPERPPGRADGAAAGAGPGAGGGAPLGDLEGGWGYLTPGSSLGNLQGLWQGREALPPGFTLLLSESAHLSVLKGAHILGLPIERVRAVLAGRDGAVDVAAFEAALRDCSSALVVLTLGTTLHGAYDDVAACLAALDARWGGQWSDADGSPGAPQGSPGAPPGSPGGLRLNYYLHLDAALGGLILPFLRAAPPDGCDGAFPPPPAPGDAEEAAAPPAAPPPARAGGACAAARWRPPAGRGAAGGGPAGGAGVKRRRRWRAPLRGVQSSPCMAGGGGGGDARPSFARAPAAAAATAGGAAAAAAGAAAPPLAAAAAPPVPDGFGGGAPPAGAVDFCCPAVCSMTVSLHKALGLGAVGAVFLSRAAFSARLSVFQEYIDSSDPTLLCSRDGHLALRAFLRLSQLGGWQGLAAMARRAVRRAARLTERLRAAGVPAEVSPRGVCVLFPADALPEGAADALGVRRCQGRGHVFTLDAVPDEALDALVEAMARGRGAGAAPGPAAPAAAAAIAAATAAVRAADAGVACGGAVL